jgi:hypothetical protein
LLTVVLFWVFVWLVGQEKSAVEAADLGICSAADYTLRLKTIPRHTDVKELEDKMRTHFEAALSKEPVVVYDMPVKVADINFGLSNPSCMKAMVKRGGISRKIDIIEEEVEAMKRRKVSEKKIAKKEKHLTKLRIKFDKFCKLVEKRSKGIKATAIFITFAGEEGFERAARAYAGHRGIFRIICGQPKRLRFPKELGGRSIRMAQAYEPSDYIWEHFGTWSIVRAIKILISNAITVVLLLAAFAAIAWLKGEESRLSEVMGNSDCSLYDVKDNPRGGFDPAWDGRYLFNTTSDGYYTLTRDRVVQDQYWQHYNLTDPGATGIACV